MAHTATGLCLVPSHPSIRLGTRQDKTSWERDNPGRPGSEGTVVVARGVDTCVRMCASDTARVFNGRGSNLREREKEADDDESRMRQLKTAGI